MKAMLCVAMCALSLLTLTSQSDGAEANGDFDFALEGATGTIEFDAGINAAGNVNGGMSFTATVDVEDPGGSGGTVPLTVTVELPFDCMVAEGNRAAMSGVIASANVPGLIGRQALLVVEDKVPGVSPTRDAFSWGVYQPNFVNFDAKDYDLCPTLPPPESGYVPDPDQALSPCLIGNPGNDTGASLTWIATDYELCPAPPPTETENFPAPPCPDPNGFTTGVPVTPTVVDCATFPLTAYPLNLIPSGGGNQVVVQVDE